MDKNPRELWKLYHLFVGNGRLGGPRSLSSQPRVKGGEGKGQGGLSLGILSPCSLSPPTLSTCLLSQHRHVTGSMGRLTRMLDYLLQEVRLWAPRSMDHTPELPGVSAFRRIEGAAFGSLGAGREGSGY